MILAAASPSPLWYLTRGSGIVTLLLLTASVCLGVASAVGWRGRSLPRFVVAGLHRNLTLLAVLFLALHVLTTVADAYTPIGFKDALIPFVSSYRPIWLGLGALASDLLIALVLTSLLRARIGYRSWRLTHWLAYASWPLALVHALGTGSDARFGWMAGLALACGACVLAAIVARTARGDLGSGSIAVLALAGASAIAIGVWYRSGPGAHGWAARAGTPAKLLASTVAEPPAATVRPPAALPAHFSAQLSGQLTQSLPDANGLVTVRIDGRLSGGLRGQLRVSLQGAPTEGGGVSLTSSGVAFQGRGPTAVYEGSVVALDGTAITADLSAPTGKALRLELALQINPGSGAVSGLVTGGSV